MFNRLSCWLNSIISLILVIACYMLVPSGLEIIRNGGLLQSISSIFIYPLLIIGCLITAINVISSLVKSLISRRWYLIALNIFILLMVVICVLTCLNILPKVV